MESADEARLVLAHLGIDRPRLLGAGVGSRVYAYGRGRVVKVHGGVERAYLERLRAFYDGLRPHRFPFAVPTIERIDQAGDVCFTVERRLPGQMLSRVLPRLSSRARRDLLARYVGAVAHFGRVSYPERPFGQMLADDPVQAPTWRRYLERMLEQRLRLAAADLREDAGDLRPIERYFERELALVEDVQTGSLVHGDYWPDNVLAAQAAGGSERASAVAGTGGAAEGDAGPDVSSVLDFDGMTVVGDSRVDVANAVIYLELLDDFRPDEHDYLLGLAIAQHGPGIERIIHLYRLWYSAAYGDCKPFDPATYWWCVRNFRGHEQVYRRLEEQSARGGASAAAGGGDGRYQ